jgi:hypothetical protein
MVENVGRRKAMMGGAAWMGVCLFIYSFIGHYMLDPINPLSTPQAGNIMIVFTCLYVFPTPFGLRTALTQQQIHCRLRNHLGSTSLGHCW